MRKATWNGAVLAESDRCQIIEGNCYFPPTSINSQYFTPSPTHTTCPWKGEASYYNIVANGQVNKDAAWTYPNPRDPARQIKGYVAFWKGVTVE